MKLSRLSVVTRRVPAERFVLLRSGCLATLPAARLLRVFAFDAMVERTAGRPRSLQWLEAGTLAVLHLTPPPLLALLTPPSLQQPLRHSCHCSPICHRCSSSACAAVWPPLPRVEAGAELAGDDPLLLAQGRAGRNAASISRQTQRQHKQQRQNSKGKRSWLFWEPPTESRVQSDVQGRKLLPLPPTSRH